MNDVGMIDPELLEKAAEWAARREATMTAEEEADFCAWLDASPRHGEALERIDVAWFSLAEAANVPELLAMRSEALERGRWLGSRRWARTALSTRLRAVAAVAVLLLLVVGGSLAWRLIPASYETGIGERRVVALADGSRVSLDAATEVQVRYFNGRRELWLIHGRAKFDVAHDPLRPFSVTAGTRTIVAIGTSFSVELVNSQMRVVLYEGRVAMVDAASQSPALSVPVLTPGREQVTDLASGAAVSTAAVDPVRSRAWEGGQLVLDEEPLGIAIARLNRYSGQRVTIADNVAAQMRVSGVFNAGDTNAFIGAAEMLLPLDVERRSGEIVLSANPQTISNGPGVNRRE